MFIGRQKETEILKKAYGSQRSEFVAVYGRRRIGKTYLIRETFKNNFTFSYTGIFNVANKIQIQEFYKSLLEQGLSDTFEKPKSWFDAFHLLEKLIDSAKEYRKVIFIDELPWMDNTNSKFVPAFEHFWNSWASSRNDILLIICGSATSWIIKKIFRNKGGLYNRVTYKLRLQQFSLAECEELAQRMRLSMNRNMILEGYMVMGGVPYYWTKLDATKSIAQNINSLFLQDDAELHHEFSYIYASMFRCPEKYIKVVEALAGKKSGMTRDEIIKKSRMDSNGQLSDILNDLIECGFVRKYCHTDRRTKDALYQLIDCFTLFYYYFLKNSVEVDEDYWPKIMGTATYHTWCGLAFEKVCLLHSRQIKAALGISGLIANLYSWHVNSNDSHPGVQIDLLIDRADNVVNVCEMKFAPNGYVITKTSLNEIKTKMVVLQQYLPPQKYVSGVLITSNGVVNNKYSDEIRLKISADQLFAI